MEAETATAIQTQAQEQAEEQEQSESQNQTENQAEQQAKEAANELNRCKVYTYERNGKTISIKRKWTNIGEKQLKQQELNDYFKNITELDNTKSIQALFKEYNNNHEHKISYSMFYKRYAEHFGPKRA